MTSTIAPPSTLATLPTEIFENISLFLSQCDLKQCVRVSRTWNELLTPCLWRTIPLFSTARFKRFMSPDIQRALYKNAVHVREVQVMLEKLYIQFLPSRLQAKVFLPEPEFTSSGDAFTISPFTNLRILELHQVQQLVWRYEFDEGIFEIVRQNRGLRRLKIGIEMAPRMLFRLVTEHVPNLQELYIESPWCGDVKALLENLPEGLRTVRLNNVTHQVPREGRGITSTIDSSASSATMGHPLQHRALNSLHIGGNLGGREEQVLAPFLESCSQNLKSISGLKLASLLRNAKISNVLSYMSVVWTHLRRDDFSNSESTDSNLAQVISIGPNWTHIALYNGFVGQLTTAAILDNCERLEVLDITGGGTGKLTGSHLQTILSKAPRLRSLQTHWVDGAERISSVDILSSEWATTSLEHVSFKINVPRVAADQEDADDDDSRALLASSRDIQRRVLRRLGQQTHLQKLAIGGMILSPATADFCRQLECLEMTLESGLDELGGLKELDHLEIHHMDHCVGVPELEWMVANFPKLKRLHGVRDSWRPLREGVEEWLSSHQPTWS